MQIDMLLIFAYFCPIPRAIVFWVILNKIQQV